MGFNDRQLILISDLSYDLRSCEHRQIQLKKHLQ